MRESSRTYLAEKKGDPCPLKSGSKNSSRGGTKIHLSVPQEGDTKKPTIALMQEPDSDTYVSNQWPKPILQQYNSNCRLESVHY
jgi:hypothetical protein